MKSINKIFVAGAVALSLGFGATSCVDDLNVTPEYPTAKTWEDVMNDPDQYLPQAFSKCYSCLAVSGQSGEVLPTLAVWIPVRVIICAPCSS